MGGGGGISEKHPEFLAMTAVIFSDVGRARAMTAADDGLPALAGVDPLLTEIFCRYRDKYHESLKNAGFIVARLMRDELGYRQGGTAKCPDGCTAVSGAMFCKQASQA